MFGIVSYIILPLPLPLSRRDRCYYRDMIRRFLPALAIHAVPVMLALGCDVDSSLPATDELAFYVRESHAIFTGRLASSEVGWAQDSWVVTLHHFEGVEWLKGGDGAADYIVAVEGGTIGTQVTRVAAFPDPESGARYLAFLWNNGRTGVPFVGGAAGLVELATDSSGACDGSGGVWHRTAAGFERRLLPGGVGPAGSLSARLRAQRGAAPAGDLFDAVVGRAEYSPTTAILTITPGGFDAFTIE